jgi:hypothetical protein
MSVISLFLTRLSLFAYVSLGLILCLKGKSVEAEPHLGRPLEVTRPFPMLLPPSKGPALISKEDLPKQDEIDPGEEAPLIPSEQGGDSSSFAEQGENVTPSGQGSVEFNYSARFRPGHNISFIMGVRQSLWEITYLMTPGLPSNMTIAQNYYATDLLLRYSFHSNVFAKFGIFFGTTAGITKDFFPKSALSPGFGFYFPTILAGIVQNYTERSRFFIGIEYGGAWFPKIRVKSQDVGLNLEISEILNSYVSFIGVETFVNKSLALGIQAGYRWMDSASINFLINQVNTAPQYYLWNRGVFFQIHSTWQIAEKLGF